MRKHFLDQIRWGTVLLVMVYHVFYLFNGVGIPGSIPGAENMILFDTLAAAVYPWFMVLLFVVAGISARYALQTRSNKDFLRSRAVKLLVPSTLGLFVVHWVTGYLNIRLGGGLAMMPSFLVYPISVISGIGPLWFIQVLFLFSCLLVLLRKLDKQDRLHTLCARTGPAVILGLGLVMWGASQLLNLPVLTMYRFGIYLAAFLAGYYVFSHDGVQAKVEQLQLPVGVAAVVLGIGWSAVYFRQDFTSPACLQSLLTNLYAWAAVLAILGWGKHCFDFATPFTKAMSKASYGLYILHYPVLLALCVFLTEVLHLPAIWHYLLALALVFPLTWAAFAIIRRIPGIRWLVLGIRKA